LIVRHFQWYSSLKQGREFEKNSCSKLLHLALAFPKKSQQKSISNPLHVFEEHLLPPAIVKLGSAAIGVTGDPLRYLKVAAIL